MANLIVTVIAIVLVTVVMIMAVWYGGAAFSTYQSKAHAGRYVNEAEQISGAVEYYRVNETKDNSYPGSIEDLVSKGYLAEKPTTNWQIVDKYAKATINGGGEAYKQCLTVREKYGFDARKNCAKSPANNEDCLRGCYAIEDGARPRTIANPNLLAKDPCCIDNSMGEYTSDIVYVE